MVRLNCRNALNIRLQWNLFIVVIPYSGHLSITGISFRFQFILFPATVLSIVEKPNSRTYKIFLWEICQHFTLEKVLQFRLNFLQSLLFHFWASLMIFSGPQKLKFAGISSLYSPPWLTSFSVPKMSKAKYGKDRNINAIMQISVAHSQPPLLCSEN